MGLKFAIISHYFKSLISQNLVLFHMICPSFQIWSELVTNSCDLLIFFPPHAGLDSLEENMEELGLLKDFCKV